MLTTVTIYHLEMTNPAQFRPRFNDDPRVRLVRLEVPDPAVNARMYAGVGVGYDWTDRLSWPLDRWRAYVDRPELETSVLEVDDQPAGYFELEQQPGDNVELAYFGLLPAFVGQGLGSHLLSLAIERAWNLEPKRVWVHTCSMDHYCALRNYQARGFKLFKTETVQRDVHDLSPHVLANHPEMTRGLDSP